MQCRHTVVDCTGTQPAHHRTPACTELQTVLSPAFLPACNSAKLRGFSPLQFIIRKIQQVLAAATLSNHKNCNENQETRKKSLCQTPANQNMAIFSNCVCEIIAENTISVKNMVNLLQLICMYLIHSCLVDMYRSLIPTQQ